MQVGLPLVHGDNQFDRFRCGEFRLQVEADGLGAVPRLKAVEDPK